MTTPQTDWTALAEQVTNDFDSPAAQTWSTQVAQLLNAPTDLSSSVALSTAFYSVVLRLADAPTAPQAEQLATFIKSSLLPALDSADAGNSTGTSSASSASLSSLEAVLVDVVWQLDQDIDCGLLDHLLGQIEPAQAEAAQNGQQMDVDSPDAAPDARAAAAKAARDQRSLAAQTRLADFTKKLIAHQLVTVSACEERLDVAFLALPTLALIRDSRAFTRLEVRSRTALYYKQQKFNLLREESEGYAKLAVELITNMGPDHDAETGLSVESSKERLARAKRVGEGVQSLIGNFDLDPDRTLDVVLDTFSSQITKHWTFFIDLLTASPWAPRPAATATAAAAESKGKEKEAPVQVGLEHEQGSRLLAQILGFKFVWYQTQEEDAPENLYLMAALLIWHGFVKLADLWPHLSPDDATLAKTEDVYRAEQEKKAAAVGGGNALAMAGALADDEDDDPNAPPKSSAQKAKDATAKAAAAAQAAAEAPRDPPNQRLALLRALLAIGDVTHSLFIVSLCPALVPANADVADLLNRILNVAIEPAFNSISFAAAHADIVAALSVPRPKAAAHHHKITTAALPKPRAGIEWTFFFPAWKDRVPKAGDWDEVLTMLELFLPLISVFVSNDFGLYSKLLRMMHRDLSDPPPATNARFPRWLTLFRLHLLPALSMLSDHAAGAIEMWRVLNLLSIEQRFALYGEWKDTLYRRIPALSVRKAEAERDAKMLLRRLSTDNVKKLGKSLAKVAHTNPTILFQIALHQVQSYDNLVGPVVDAARYLTDFGYDVLAYSLLDALSSGKSKVKEDGTSVALWLTSLASFAGQLYRRWNTMQTSLPTILQYLVNQLVSGSSKDLIVLRELVGRMTGLEPFADLSDAQVMSLAGGAVLRSEVFNQTDIATGSKRGQAAAQAAARERLKEALLKSGLSVPLLVSIGWQRQVCVAGAETHLKSLGALFDQCHAVLFQYQELLGAVLEPELLAELLPTTTDLLARGFEPAVAFDMTRPKLRVGMKVYDDEEVRKARIKSDALATKLKQAKLAKSTPSIEAVKSEVETPVGVGIVEEGAGEVAVPVTQLGNEDVGMADAEADVLAAAAATASPAIAESELPASPKPQAIWHPGLADLVVDIDEFVPRRAREVMGSAFFVTFWQLTLYDIHYPKDRYESEAERLQALSKEVAISQTIPGAEKPAFVESIIKITTNVVQEMQRHSNATSATRRRLTREKPHWFANVDTKQKRLELVRQILQECVVPRAKLSLPDAAFAYQFIKRIHALNTPQFHTLVFYDQLLSSQLAPILYLCSENEARNFARFLFDVLTDVSRWYTNEAAYNDEAIGSPNKLSGFLRAMARAGAPDLAPGDWLSHEQFKKVATLWHKHSASGFVDGFETDEYMHIKNSILVLTKLAPVFPLEYAHGVQLENGVVALIAKEKREDLKILAQGYKAVLNKRKKLWANQPSKPKAPTPPPPAAPAKPRDDDKAKAPTRGVPIPLSASATAALAAQSNSRGGLPPKPDNKSRDSRSTDKKPIEVDPPTGPASRRPETNGNGAASHSSLPARPGQSRDTKPQTTNGSSTRADDRQDDRRRQPQAATMDPPPAPSQSSNSKTAPSPANSRRTSPAPSAGRDSRRGDDRSERAPVASTAPAADLRNERNGERSRAGSNDGSHSSREQRDRDRDRERGSRANERDRDAGRGARDAPRGTREEERRRRVDDDRDKARGGGRVSAVASAYEQRDRLSRGGRDEPVVRRARSPVRDERAPRRDQPPASTSDRTASAPTGPRADRAPAAASASSSSNLPNRPTDNSRAPPAPAADRDSHPSRDRLKPAPASRSASGTSTPVPAAAASGDDSPNALFSIKGRSSGANRLLDAALGSGSPAEPGAGGGGRSDSPGRRSARDRADTPVARAAEDDRLGGGRKRPALAASTGSGSSGALFDRLGANEERRGGGGGGGGDSGLPKRPRTDRDPDDRDRHGSSRGGGGGGGYGGRERGPEGYGAESREYSGGRGERRSGAGRSGRR